MEEKFRYLLQRQDTATQVVEPKIDDEMAQCEKSAFDQGYQQAQQEIAQESTTNTEDAYLLLLQKINDNINALTLNNQNNYENALYELAIAIGEKLSSLALEDKYLEIVKNFVNDILSEIKENTAITIRVNDKLVEKLQKELVGCTVASDVQLAISDCVVMWEHGAAIKILKDKKIEIEQILQMRCKDD